MKIDHFSCPATCEISCMLAQTMPDQAIDCVSVPGRPNLMWNHTLTAAAAETSFPWDEGTAKAMASSAHDESGTSFVHGVNSFMPYYDPSSENGSYSIYSEVHVKQQLSAAPHIQWWKHKFQERQESTTAYKLRCVANMCPTNLGPTQPKGCRNKAKEQRIRCQEQRKIPVVPQPFRPPCDIGLAMTLAKLEESGVPGVAEVQQVVHESFNKAYESVVKAARAYELQED